MYSVKLLIKKLKVKQVGHKLFLNFKSTKKVKHKFQKNKRAQLLSKIRSKLSVLVLSKARKGFSLLTMPTLKSFNRGPFAEKGIPKR